MPTRSGVQNVPLNGGPRLRSSSRRRRSNSTAHSRKRSEDSRALYKDLDQYQDALNQVKPKVLSSNGHLDAEDRNSLASVYKNILNGLRVQLDTSSTKPVVVSEINRVCDEVIDLLRQWLIPAATSGEESVFYWKMFADFHRYLWETPAESGASSEDHANAAFQAYKLACLHANQHLDPTHRTRLGLALNFSVFYHEVLNSPERACHVAKFAFDQAVEYSQAHPGEVCNDEALGVMQLLQNNLIAWMQETR